MKSSSAEVGTGLGLERGEGSGSRAAAVSFAPEPLQALVLLAGGATDLRPRE